MLPPGFCLILKTHLHSTACLCAGRDTRVQVWFCKTASYSAYMACNHSGLYIACLWLVGSIWVIKRVGWSLFWTIPCFPLVAMVWVLWGWIRWGEAYCKEWPSTDAEGAVWLLLWDAMDADWFPEVEGDKVVIGIGFKIGPEGRWWWDEDWELWEPWGRWQNFDVVDWQ